MHRSITKWQAGDIREVLPRTYLLRPVAAEVFATTGVSEMLVFHPADAEAALSWGGGLPYGPKKTVYISIGIEDLSRDSVFFGIVGTPR